ncbi:unnamed protein product, partial [Polarella glacialis]
ALGAPAAEVFPDQPQDDLMQLPSVPQHQDDPIQFGAGSETLPSVPQHQEIGIKSETLPSVPLHQEISSRSEISIRLPSVPLHQ